jgi:hypothetical protein
VAADHRRRWIAGLVAVMVVLGIVWRAGTRTESRGGSLPGGSYFYSRTTYTAWASAAGWLLVGLVVISALAAIGWAIFSHRRQLREHRWAVAAGVLALVLVGVVGLGVHGETRSGTASSSASTTIVPSQPQPQSLYQIAVECQSNPRLPECRALPQNSLPQFSHWNPVVAAIFPLLLYGIMISGLVAFVWMFFSYRQHLREHERHDHPSRM